MNVSNVAFIDVLGFRAMIYDLRHKPHLKPKIHQVLEAFRDVDLRYKKDQKFFSQLKATCFSDSLVISSNDLDAERFVFAIGDLQARMLFNGILLRGGITKGLLFHEEGIIYGEGLIEAYDIESKKAKYPRVVLSQDFVNNTTNALLNSTCIKSEDGAWSVDPFRYHHCIYPVWATPDERDEDLVNFLSGIQSYLLNQLEATNSTKVQEKLVWMLQRIRDRANDLLNAWSYLHDELERVISAYPHFPQQSCH